MTGPLAFLAISAVAYATAEYWAFRRRRLTVSSHPGSHEEKIMSEVQQPELLLADGRRIPLLFHKCPRCKREIGWAYVAVPEGVDLGLLLPDPELRPLFAVPFEGIRTVAGGLDLVEHLPCFRGRGDYHLAIDPQDLDDDDEPEDVRRVDP
jgi:hypothetical protein